MSGRTPVTAIIVNWKSAEDTIRLVESLLPNTEEGLRFVVLENGSNDDSDTVLRERFAAAPFAEVVTYFSSETNLGFCAGVNRAVDVALAVEPKPAHLWFLNPDIFPGTDTLSELVAVAVESGCQIVSARAGAAIPFNGDERWPLPYFAPGFLWKTRPQPGKRWWTTGRYHGGCVIFETELVEKLRAQGSFLHEPLFMYWDEWDTSIRADRLGARFAVANLLIRHHTTERNALPGLRNTRTYYGARNGILMAERYFSWWQRLLFVPPHIARGLLYYCVLHGSPWRPYLAGLLAGFRGRTGIWEHHPR